MDVWLPGSTGCTFNNESRQQWRLIIWKSKVGKPFVGEHFSLSLSLFSLLSSLFSLFFSLFVLAHWMQLMKRRWRMARWQVENAAAAQWRCIIAVLAQPPTPPTPVPPPPPLGPPPPPPPPPQCITSKSGRLQLLLPELLLSIMRGIVHFHWRIQWARARRGHHQPRPSLPLLLPPPPGPVPARPPPPALAAPVVAARVTMQPSEIETSALANPSSESNRSLAHLSWQSFHQLWMREPRCSCPQLWWPSPPTSPPPTFPSPTHPHTYNLHGEDTRNQNWTNHQTNQSNWY